MSRNELIKELQKYFKVQELVCNHCYTKFGEQSWLFLSTELLSTIYTLRCIIFNKPITINTWHNGGGFSQRGIRCNICQLVKSKNDIYMSAHCLSKAIDFNVKDMDTKQVYDIIRLNIDKFEYPIRIESNSTTWCHVDCYCNSTSNSKLIEFNG